MAGKQGFGSMGKKEQKEIAAMGGRKTAGRNLTPEARARGGRNSRSGRKSS